MAGVKQPQIKIKERKLGLRDLDFDYRDSLIRLQDDLIGRIYDVKPWIILSGYPPKEKDLNKLIYGKY